MSIVLLDVVGVGVGVGVVAGVGDCVAGVDRVAGLSVWQAVQKNPGFLNLRRIDAARQIANTVCAPFLS
jgi:hypothetical protein